MENVMFLLQQICGLIYLSVLRFCLFSICQWSRRVSPFFPAELFCLPETSRFKKLSKNCWLQYSIFIEVMVFIVSLYLNFHGGDLMSQVKPSLFRVSLLRNSSTLQMQQVPLQ